LCAPATEERVGQSQFSRTGCIFNGEAPAAESSITVYNPVIVGGKCVTNFRTRSPLAVVLAPHHLFLFIF